MYLQLYQKIYSKNRKATGMTDSESYQDFKMFQFATVRPRTGLAEEILNEQMNTCS